VYLTDYKVAFYNLVNYLLFKGSLFSLLTSIARMHIITVYSEHLHCLKIMLHIFVITGIHHTFATVLLGTDLQLLQLF